MLVSESDDDGGEKPIENDADEKTVSAMAIIVAENVAETKPNDGNVATLAAAENDALITTATASGLPPFSNSFAPQLPADVPLPQSSAEMCIQTNEPQYFLNLGDVVVHHDIINEDDINKTVGAPQISEEIEIASEDLLVHAEGDDEGDDDGESSVGEIGTGSSDDNESILHNADGAGDDKDLDEIEDDKQIKVSSLSAGIIFSCNNECDYFRKCIVCVI